MKVVLDLEANSLTVPDQIWIIVCKDADTGELHVFRNPSTRPDERRRFLDFSKRVTCWIGHNFLSYDYPVLNNLLGYSDPDVANKTVDTLILSKMIDYSRKGGHSIEQYGKEFGLEKIKFNDFKKYSQGMEDYCVRDVDICHRIYSKFNRIIHSDNWQSAIILEHQFQLVVNALTANGFYFNRDAAGKLLERVQKELDKLDKEIEDAFPPRLKPVREIHPSLTKHGTLHRKDFKWVKGGDLSEYSEAPFTLCRWESFNPSSHKQLIDVLHQAGWSPVDKTTTHTDTDREVQRLKYKKTKLDLQPYYDKLLILEKYGWKINEANLATLPETAPPPARLLAKRILYESRRRTLTEWLGLVHPDTGRIHGTFQGIGAWTHRMAHQKPNTANIPNEYDTQGKRKLLGKEMRSLWRAPRNRLLVGVDAEGIQLRIFAHYIDDKEFTLSLVEGKKDDKTDPHSLNARILGSVCRSRQAAKRFIYALLLGAGVGKLAQILETSEDEARRALARLMERYQGFTRLKESIIPADAKRGWFEGLDGRAVKIPGDTPSERRHLVMSGYLQNGEAIIMKKASLKWQDLLKEKDAILVNFVHDEWQTEAPNDMKIALHIAKMQTDSLESVGREIGLKCPLAGSYWNDDHKDYTIGTNWSVTH